LKFILYIFSIFLFFSCSNSEGKKSAKAQPDDSDTIFRQLTDAEKNAYSQRLTSMYDSILVRHRFNGGIIIAKNGQILLEDYRGYADFATHDTITPNTPFHLASISKTFTGMAIMKLVEEHKIGLYDSIQHFFPGFPYPGITVKLLLTHRSGLPNYPYFLTKDTSFRKRMATNQDMLDYLINNKPAIYGYPDRGFHYCNTNYALLALIVEKVTGQPFPDYMKSEVFGPLQMDNTFVFSIKDTANYKPSYLANNRPVPLEPMDCIYGDKNVYSTPRDLLKWDEAMYKNSFVSQGTYEEATTPYSNERPSKHNYGMGWRLMMLPDTKIVYHNGWWHGNNTSLTRFVRDTATVIILGNKYNRLIYSGMKFGTVFNRNVDSSKQEE
jgi:CubicO group peptidase (beta-lactamase class C family)